MTERPGEALRSNRLAAVNLLLGLLLALTVERCSAETIRVRTLEFYAEHFAKMNALNIELAAQSTALDSENRRLSAQLITAYEACMAAATP